MNKQIEQILRKFYPENKEKQLIIDIATEEAEKFNITTKNDISFAFANIMHETQNFTKTEENGNFSVEILKKKFSYFKKNPKQAEMYGRIDGKQKANPEMIFNCAYANRMGNGDITSGDGNKHRGFGWLELTGKDDQNKFAEYYGGKIEQEIKNNYELISKSPFFRVTSAFWFIKDKNLKEYADKNDFTLYCKRINSALSGIEDRRNYLNLIKKIL